MDARRLIARMTICKLRGHKWAQVTYPSSEEGAAGRFRRCLSCGKEHHGNITRTPWG